VTVRDSLELIALIVDEAGLDAEERQCRRSALEVERAGKRRDQDSSRLGLPPRVDDRAAPLADVLAIPAPRLGIDRLANGAEKPHARHRVSNGPVLSFGP